jgi:hypothetical protein
MAPALLQLRVLRLGFFQDQVKRHLRTAMLGSLTPESIAVYIAPAQCYPNAKRLLHTRRNVTLRRVAFISPNPIESSPKITGHLRDNGLVNIYKRAGSSLSSPPSGNSGRRVFLQNVNFFCVEEFWAVLMFG